jgi:YesN/AraC family two-component response regulator
MNTSWIVHRIKDRFILIIFLAILLVSAISVLLYERNASNEYMAEKQYYFEKSHEKAYSSFFLYTERLNSIYWQMLLDRTITDWLNHPRELISDMYDLSQIQTSFIDLTNTHSGLVSIYLHNTKNNIVISTPFMLSELPSFPNKSIFERFYAGKQPFQWQPFGPELQGNQNSTEIIAMTIGMPIQARAGALSINLSRKYIEEEIMTDHEFMLWLDGSNQVLLSKNEEALRFFEDHKNEILNTKQSSFMLKDRFIISSSNEAGNWKLLTVLPKAELKREGSFKNTYIWLLLMLSTVMGAMLVIYFRFIRRAQEQQLEIKIERSLDDFRKGLVTDLLNGKPVLADLAQKSEEYRIDLSGEGYQVVVFQIDNYYNYLLSKSNHERFFMNKMVYNSIRWTFALRFKSYVVNTELEKVTVLLCYDNEVLDGETTKRLEDTIRYIQDDIRDNSGLTVCAGISDVVNDIGHIQSSYAHAMLAVDYKAVYGKHSLIYYENLPVSERSTSKKLTPDIHRINDYLKEGRLEAIEELLDQLLKELVSNEHFTLDWIHAIFANIMSAIMKFVIEHRIDINGPSGGDVFITLYSYEFMEEKKSYILKICSEIIEAMQSEPEEKHATAQLIVDYIDKRFDQPISLGMMADELSLSPSYLSVMIKNHLGVGFVEYVSKLRIQKAVKLLEDDGKTIQQIAEACGYDTVHTFIRQFKKSHGMPPNEYRHKRKTTRM